MAEIDSNYKYLKYEEMAKNIAELALDEVLYDGKSIREWMQIIASEDCISRQAVLEIIRKCHCEEWIKADIGAPIEALSSVIPQSKIGKWIVSEGGYFRICPFCSAEIDVSVGTGIYVDNNDEVSHINYCPNCGAKMEVVE